MARSSANLAAAAAEAGPRAVPVAVDITDPDSVRAAFAAIEDRAGGLDVLVNNAVVGWPHRIEQATDDELQAEVATNLLGPLYVIRSALPLLRRSSDPHIVNVSSDSVDDPFPYLLVYAATKAGLENLTRGLQGELRPDGVRVALLRVGQTDGGEFRMHWPAERRAEAEQAWLHLGFKARVSGGLVGQPPEQVAEAVAYMVTRPQGSFIDTMTVRAHGGRP